MQEIKIERSQGFIHCLIIVKSDPVLIVDMPLEKASKEYKGL